MSSLYKYPICRVYGRHFLKHYSCCEICQNSSVHPVGLVHHYFYRYNFVKYLLLTLIKLLSFAITDLRTWSDLMLKYLSENKHEGNVMCLNNWSANNLPNQLCHLLPSYVFLNFDYRLGICDCLRALVDCSASRRQQGLPPLPMIPSEDADKALLDIKLPAKSPMYANPLCPRGKSYLKHFALCETCHNNNVHPVLVVRHAPK
jgi:hypothetical protein